MTILSALSDGLARADRLLGAYRRGEPLGLSPFLAPVGADPPLPLSGGKVITYADTVAQYPTVFGVWSKILQTLSTTDIQVYRRLDRGRRERVFDTDLEQLLREPAPGKGLVDLLQWLFNPYLVEGNGLIAKWRGEDGDPNALPKNLIPLDWRYMSALARPGGPVEYWISHQIGEPRDIPPSEVVHMAWHNTDGSEIGPSALRALGTSIRMADAADRFQTSSLDNSIRPSGALVIPAEKETTREERDEMQERVAKQHAGVDNAFRTIVLFGGVEWKPMSFTAEQAELIDTRNATKEDVCIAYGVKRGVIEQLEGGTIGATAEVLKDFQRSLHPHAGLFANVIKRQLIDPEPAWREERYEVNLDLSGLVRGTFKEEVETAGYAYVSGLASEDEAREHIGWEPRGTAESKVPRVPYAQLQPGRDGRSLPASDENGSS